MGGGETVKGFSVEFVKDEKVSVHDGFRNLTCK